MNNISENLGESDMKIAGLAICIHGRQFPDSKDYWDANWLNVTVHCGAQGSSVKASGNIVHLSEIVEFLSSVERVYNGSNDKARLSCIEPNLRINLEKENLGHLRMSIDITPDHLSQKHNFLFEIDQSYMPRLISECKTILKKYPIIGKP